MRPKQEVFGNYIGLKAIKSGGEEVDESGWPANKTHGRKIERNRGRDETKNQGNNS